LQEKMLLIDVVKKLLIMVELPIRVAGRYIPEEIQNSFNSFPRNEWTEALNYCQKLPGKAQWHTVLVHYKHQLDTEKTM
jgi:hypothetical protein